MNPLLDQERSTPLVTKTRPVAAARPRGLARQRVVVVGGGFAGLQAVRKLARAPVDVTLIDRRNFHLFQPLAYQVATGSLSPAEIASPLRGVLRRQTNARVLLAEVSGFDLAHRRVLTTDLAPAAVCVRGCRDRACRRPPRAMVDVRRRRRGPDRSRDGGADRGDGAANTQARISSDRSARSAHPPDRSLRPCARDLSTS